MMFKNSFRLLSANFDKVWKLLVYQLLSWALVLALLAPFYQTLISCAKTSFEAQTLGEIFTSGTFYGLNVGYALSHICLAIIGFFKGVFASSIGIGIYFLIIVFLVRPILSNIGKYVICEMVYGYMAAGSRHGFTSTLLRTLKKSLSFSALKTLYCLPFDALILGSLFGLTYFNSEAYSYAMPLLIVIVPSLFFALKETFSAGWAPAMIVFGLGAVKAYPKGMKACFRRGLRVYSTAFIIYILAFVLSMVIGLYSLIIILPIIFPLFDIFEMVMFFSSQGMRFYVDADTILAPKKLEEVDKIEDAKYLL